MSSDDLLVDVAANCGGAYRYWAEAMGKPTHLWDDLSIGDLGLAAALPVNNATLLGPDADVDDVVDRIVGFFADLPGGGYEFWCAWPTPDLSPRGFESNTVPWMVRDVGGDRPPPPRELKIREAADSATARAAEVLLDDVFGCGSPAPGTVVAPSLMSEQFRMWVGFVDGRPVSTSAAYVGGGFVGVYAVVTTPEARGRGYGEALTWAATAFRSGLPATLQASPMGKPVYERMGYREMGAFTVWDRPRR